MRGFIFFVLCWGVGAKPTMQQYGENMGILLENLAAFDAHPRVEQRKKVVDALFSLKGLSHAIQPTLAVYAVDPIMLYLSLDLPQQFSRIDSAYAAGDYASARNLLRQTTQYCVGCHTSSSNKNSALPSFHEPLLAARGIEKAEFLSATRRHEEAMVAYEQALADKNFKTAQPELWEQAVVNLLAITIRLRGDASVTLEMISALLDEGGYRPEQLDKLQAWRLSAKAWAKEPISVNRDPAASLNKSQQLLAHRSPIKNFGLVENLRAAALLNEVSMSQATPDQKAQAYRLMAQVSESLRGVFLWMRPEAYYEACIRLKPHSDEARHCSDGLQALQKSPKDALFDAEKLQELITLAK